MKTSSQYIKEIKAAINSLEPCKAIEIFNNVAESGNISLITEVHKACGRQIVAATSSPEYKIKHAILLEEQEKARRKKEDQTGRWRLRRWPELKKAGILKEGDLVQISLDDIPEGHLTTKELAMHASNVWDNVFTKKRNGHVIEYECTGLIYFESKSMCLLHPDGESPPIPIFPDSGRKFRYSTISIISKTP